MNRLTEKYDDGCGYGVIEKYQREAHVYVDFDAYDNCVDKLGQYEDIDDDPKHLAKIKKALEIIKNNNVVIYLITKYDCVDDYNNDENVIHQLVQDDFNLLKEVLL